ncbi:unnamed protein product [Parnassius apollo]|uniref:(apollo) hypothetical protein n=1 Tax=Parnassius apollo TaxID=110799 RepID=A0A8S3W9E6_PARAO|nr:unnamed protein product [Parnassius apollo]
MSRTAHVVDGEASESDSEIEVGKSPDSNLSASKAFVISGEAPESDDESKLPSPTCVNELDAPLRVSMSPQNSTTKLYNSILHQKLCE